MRSLPPRIYYYVLLICFIAFSCKKTDFKSKEIQANVAEEKVEFPTTAKELRQVQINKDIASVLEYVYQDNKAYYEVNATIYSEYYPDEFVMLRDLLFPENSPLYKSEKFKSYKSPVGLFKQRFLEGLGKGDYSVLKEAMGLKKHNNNVDSRLTTIKSRFDVLSAAGPLDTLQEIYSKSDGSIIYFPYSENFGSNFSKYYFDNINTSPTGPKATIVATDRDADSGPGNEPYICGTRDNQSLCFRTVTVNDAYAEIRSTHIVGIRDGSLMPDTDPPPIGPAINRVYSGWSRIAKGQQKDRLISFSGNGGGSEVKICRISGYLQMADQQVTNFSGDEHSVYFKRRDIRKGKWKRTYAVWDPDWKTDNLEQVYAVYENDNKNEQTFTGTLTTAATVPITGGGTVTATRTLTYNIKVSSSDQIFTQRKQDRYSYFRDAKNTQGWGFQMCDDQECRYDDTFLPSGQYWPKWDEGSVWGFTWSYKTY